MARRESRSGKRAAIANLRVQLIPVRKENFDVTTHRQVIGHLLSMMVLNLHKRGRPKKNEEGELSYAI